MDLTPQVTVNQRFEVYFPERRRFFIESISYFDTPLQMRFTRRIRDPQFGARLSGKVGRWNVGLWGIDDRANGLTVDPGSLLDGTKTAGAAARVQREFGRDSNIGILATGQQFGESINGTISADLRWRMNPTWYFTGQWTISADTSYDSNLLLRPSQKVLA